jgi:DNA-binding MarR family transcriptional regulator
MWQAGRVSGSLDFDPIDEARRQGLKHWGAAPAPSMVAVTSVMRVEQILTARLNGLLKPWDLTFPRYEALMLLYYSRNGSLPLGKIGARLQVHPTSITNTIDGLQKLGYVERTRHQDDRRKWLASITDRGREVAEEATQVINDARFGTRPLKRAQLQQLFEILRDLRADEDAFGAETH